MRLVNFSTYEPEKVFSRVVRHLPDYFAPSLTVPDMSLSLRQLLDRHKSGGNVKTFSPVYTDGFDLLPDGFERMSKVDRAQLLLDTSDFISTTRGRIITARESRQRDRLEAARIAASSPAVPPPDVPSPKASKSDKVEE